MSFKKKLAIVKFVENGNSLRNAFVTQACAAYAKTILDNPEIVRGAMKNHIINPDAWIVTAADYQREVQAQINHSFKK